MKAYYEDGVNITGYTAWTLMDNFEWRAGFSLVHIYLIDKKCARLHQTVFFFSERFGFYHVNITDPSRPRTAKKSAEMYKNLLATRELQIEEKEQVHQ